MEDKMSVGYTITRVARWTVVILATLMAFWLYGYPLAVFTLVVAILSHEIPTLAMGIYIYYQMRKAKNGDESDRMD